MLEALLSSGLPAVLCWKEVGGTWFGGWMEKTGSLPSLCVWEAHHADVPTRVPTHVTSRTGAFPMPHTHTHNCSRIFLFVEGLVDQERGNNIVAFLAFISYVRRSSRYGRINRFKGTDFFFLVSRWVVWTLRCGTGARFLVEWTRHLMFDETFCHYSKHKIEEYDERLLEIVRRIEKHNSAQLIQFVSDLSNLSVSGVCLFSFSGTFRLPRSHRYM